MKKEPKRIKTIKSIKRRIDKREAKISKKLLKKARIDIADPSWKDRYKTESEYVNPLEVNIKKIGRPSTYKRSYPVDLILFFNRGRQRIDRLIDKKTGEIVMDYGSTIGSFPTLEAFAVKIGTHPATLWEWGRKFPEFYEALQVAKAIQKEILVDGALRNSYNPLFAKFVAVNFTDMRDKTEVETKTNKPRFDLSKVPPEKLAAILDLLKDGIVEDGEEGVDEQQPELRS